MNHIKYCVVSGVLLVLVALVHLLRIVYGLSVQVDNFAVPMTASWVALLVAGALGIWALLIVRASATRSGPQ